MAELQLENTPSMGALAAESEPDGILPSQYYAALKHHSRLEGERRLMFAVLADAVECYLKGINSKGHQQRILFSEVQEWFNSTRENGPFAFVVLCEEFGMNASEMRKALQRRRDHRSAVNGISATRNQHLAPRFR